MTRGAQSVDVFHLPALEDGDIDGWTVTSVEGAFELRWPILTSRGVARIARVVRNAGTALRARPVAEIVEAIDRATALLMDDSAKLSVLTDQVSAVTGYSPRMTAHVLARMAEDWRTPALQAVLDAEFGIENPVDQFIPANGGRIRAFGPDLSLHIFSGNVPGVAVTSMIRALLVKAPVLGKTASGEPLLAAAFARAIASVDAGIGSAIAVTYWPGGSADLEAAAFAEADLIVHYGGRNAVDDIRARAPDHVRMVEHGPKMSFGMVASDAIQVEEDARTLAREIALAAATFDQQGCVSPHVIFVESTPDQVRHFAGLVADAFDGVEMDLPMGRLTDSDATAVRRARDDAEFRGIAGEDMRLWGNAELSHTVIYDGTPAFTASCLNRTLTIHPVDSLRDVVEIIRPFGVVLQSAALAAPAWQTNELAPPLAAVGVSRVTTFRDLPWPPPGWHHDGRGPLRELVRWVDLEV